MFQVFNNTVSKISHHLLASCEISNIMAKAGKVYNIGETVNLPVVSVPTSSFMKQNARKMTNSMLHTAFLCHDVEK